jgi:SAM-dependent methyltransferase
MAAWLHSATTGLNPRSILDVGCGAGWSMLATRMLFPDALIEGVEPAKANAELARRAGFKVQSFKIGTDRLLEKSYDLIYSNNVLQHVLSPISFLTELNEHLSEHGLLVLICPDASRPSNEMLWCDHNFSFQPRHLLRLAEVAGLRVTAWQPNPANNSLLDKQLIVLTKGSDAHARVGKLGAPEISGAEQYDDRCRYVQSWRDIHAHLRDATADCSRVFNFGASMWTWLLAAYCPDWWRKVECCLVDEFDGTCLDKKVKPTTSVTLSASDYLVLGINPVNQGEMATRFRQAQFKTIRWDGYVKA